MRNAEFENILDTCIAEIRSGRSTVEKCLQRYADHAPALDPMLRDAAQLVSLPLVAMPAKVVDAVEQRVLSRAAEIREALPQKERPERRPFWSRLTIRRLRLLPAALSLAIALIIASTWTVSASASSLPGEALYPVKLVTEKARLTFTFRPGARAELHLKFAERRLVETQALLDQSGPLDEGLLQALATETALALQEIEETNVGKKAEVATKLLALTERQQAVLTSVQERVPEKAQKGLSQAIEASRRGHERAMMVLGMTPEPPSTPGDSATPTPHVKPTRKPTHTPKPTHTLRVKPTRKPTHTPKPTHMRLTTPTRTPKPTKTPKPKE